MPNTINMNGTQNTMNPADYTNYALKVAKSMRLPHWIKDDSEGIALEALVRAAAIYDGRMGPEGYVKVKVRQALLDACRSHLGRGKDENKAKVVSLSTLTHIDDDTDTCEYNVADGSANDAETRMVLENVRNALANMKPKYRRAVELKLEGYKGLEIASELGLTQGRVSQILKQVAETMQRKCG